MSETIRFVLHDCELILSISSYFEMNKKVNLECKVGESNKFLEWVNGSIDRDDLRELRSPPNFEKPKEFSLEKWEILGWDRTTGYKWGHSYNILFKGINWLDASPSPFGKSGVYTGIVNFNYEQKLFIGNNLKTIEVLDKETSYPSLAFDIAIQEFYKSGGLKSVCTCDSKDLLWYGCRCLNAKS